MLIFDGDYPMALGVAMNRDLTRPVEEVRTAEPHAGTLRGWPDKEVMATIPEIRRGEIGAALVKAIPCIKRPGYKHGECRTDEIAYAQAKGRIGQTNAILPAACGRSPPAAGGCGPRSRHAARRRAALLEKALEMAPNVLKHP